MNNLPVELHLKILNYLPGKSISAFERLNKYYSALLKRNWRTLPRYTVTLILGQKSPENGQRHSFTIVTPTEEIPLFCMHKTIYPPSQGVSLIKSSFESWARNQPNRNYINLFFIWFLDKVDLTHLEIYLGRFCYDLTELMMEAIRTTSRFRCNQIILHNHYHDIFTCDAAKIYRYFLPRFCDLQRFRGEKPQLFIKPRERIEGVINHMDHVYMLIMFSSWFSDVLMECHCSSLVGALNAICLRWLCPLNGVNVYYSNRERRTLTPLEAINFRIRLKYGQKVENQTERANIVTYAEELFTLGLGVDLFTQDDIVALANIEAFSWLPEEIVCRRNVDDQALKFKFTKESEELKTVILTMELEN